VCYIFRCPLINKCYKVNYGGTAEACGIVAGAAALVLEQFPLYTPEEVKQHLVNKATDGAISWLAPSRIRPGTPNRMLYIGSDESMGKLHYYINNLIN